MKFQPYQERLFDFLESGKKFSFRPCPRVSKQVRPQIAGCRPSVIFIEEIAWDKMAGSPKTGKNS